MAQQIIVAGDISEEATAYLREHGAQFLTVFGAGAVLLPETARVEKDGYDWRYAIYFGEEEDDNGDYPPYCELELYANAADTRIVLKKGN